MNKEQEIILDDFENFISGHRISLKVLTEMKQMLDLLYEESVRIKDFTDADFEQDREVQRCKFEALQTLQKFVEDGMSVKELTKKVEEFAQKA